MGLTRVQGGGLQPTILDPIQNLYTGSTVVFTVTVASKDTTHRYNGQGSSNGYKIDGKFAPFLVLTPGVTYKFDQADGSNSGHPLRFYKDAAKVTAYTTNVTTNGTAGSSGAYTQIVTGDATPTILYYQCSAHGFMGNAIQTNGLASSVPDDGAITTAKLADDAVNNDKLANSVVASIAANTAKTSNATHTGDVTGSTSLTIANNAVTTAKIADNAVTTAKIADNAVTTAKLPTDAVTSAKLANNAVYTAAIQSNAVTTAKIGDQEVTLAKLPHGTGSNDGKFLRANNGADPSFETVTSTTINNNADNRVITGSGTANTLNAESNVVVDSSGRLILNQTSTPIATKIVSKVAASSNVGWAQCGLAVTHASGLNRKSLIGFGFSGNGGTYPPAAIGSISTNTSSNENAALGFYTRSATSDTEPSERMRINSYGSLVRSGHSYANYVVSMKTVSSSSAKNVQVLEDCYGQWLVVAKITSTNEFKGVMNSTATLDTTNNQVTGDPQWSSLFGDTYPSEVRYISASDWNNWRDTRIIDFVHGVPEDRLYKEFFTNGNSSGMGIVADSKHGWKCAGAYDGFGRWRNPKFENHKMADTNAGGNSANNPIITSAFFTTAGQTMNWHNGNEDAKIFASHNDTTDGQDDEYTTGWGWDDGGLIRSDEFPNKGSNGSGTDLADYNLWVCIKLSGAARDR